MADLTTAAPNDSVNGSDLFVFEDYTQRIIIAAILGLVFIIGVTGNTLVILAVILSRKLRSVTNYFIVNLACADLLTCLSLPFQMVAMSSRNGWPLPEWVCAVTSATSLVCILASVDTLALIAYNRWYLLTQSKLNFQKLYRKRNMWLMVLWAWLYPLILVLVPHFAGLGRLGYSSNYKSCTQDTTTPSSDYYSLLAAAFAIIPIFIAIVVIYSRIYRFVSKQNKKMAAVSQKGVPRATNKRQTESVSIEMSSSSSATTQNTTSSALSDKPESIMAFHQKSISASHSFYHGKRQVTSRSCQVNMSDDEGESDRDVDASEIVKTSCSMTQEKKESQSSHGVATVKRERQKKSTPSGKLNRHQVTVTKKLAIVVLAFFICLLPFGVSVAVPPSDPGIPWTGLMVTFNSCINPIIYARTMPTL